MLNEVETYILEHQSDDVIRLSREVSDKFGKFIPASTVSKILARRTRADNLFHAKSAASSTLADKVQVVESVSEKLLAKFEADDLPFKDRIEAVKELRQWVKLGNDMAGIHDEESDTLFIVDSSWDVSPRAVN